MLKSKKHPRQEISFNSAATIDATVIKQNSVAVTANATTARIQKESRKNQVKVHPKNEIQTDARSSWVFEQPSNH